MRKENHLNIEQGREKMHPVEFGESPCSVQMALVWKINYLFMLRIHPGS